MTRFLRKGLGAAGKVGVARGAVELAGAEEVRAAEVEAEGEEAVVVGKVVVPARVVEERARAVAKLEVDRPPGPPQEAAKVERRQVGVAMPVARQGAVARVAHRPVLPAVELRAAHLAQVMRQPVLAERVARPQVEAVKDQLQAARRLAHLLAVVERPQVAAKQLPLNRHRPERGAALPPDPNPAPRHHKCRQERNGSATS